MDQDVLFGEESKQDDIPPPVADADRVPDIVSVEQMAKMDEFEEGEISRKTYLSIFWQKGRLGVAFYETDSRELFVTEVAESDDFACLQLIKFQTEPTEIIVSSNEKESFYEAVRCSVDSDFPDQEHIMKIVKRTDYDFEAARHSISQIVTPQMPSTDKFTEKEFTQYLTSALDFSQEQMIKATGALLTMLCRQRLNDDFSPEENSKIYLAGLHSFSLSGILSLDANTSKSLQIFQVEQHPSVQGLGRAKEGLSLFSLYCTRTKSVVGRRLLRHWFVRPILHVDTLEYRLATIEQLLNPLNENMVKTVSSSLSHVSDLQGVISRIYNAKASVNDYWKLCETTSHMIAIKDITLLYELQDLNLFKKIEDIFTENIRELNGLLSSVIDYDESMSNDRCIIRNGVDSELDKYKEVYNNLDEILTTVAAEEMQKLPENCPISAFRYIYFPQIGYLVVIGKEESNGWEETAPKLGFELQFETNACAYFKSERALELDESLSDVHALIVDRENRIIRELDEIILENSSTLLGAINVCAELDCLIAFTSVARDYNYCKPTLTNEAKMDIEGGRHPLQELCVETFIPNDIHLGGKSTHMQIIMGPNSSGKSVLLKQAATIAFMAHLGSFVPAASAIIGLTDRIFSRIQTRETATIAQSTFMIDTTQIARALNHSTSKSMIIIDEYGKGTGQTEGISLLSAVIKFLLAKGKNCPRTLITTHLHEIIELEWAKTMTNYISFNNMEVMIEKNDDDGNGEMRKDFDQPLVFLYKLKPGNCVDSFGSHCAVSAGVPLPIIKRAEEVSMLLSKNLPVGRLDAARTEETVKKYTQIAEDFLAFDIEKGDVKQFVNRINAIAN